MQYISTQVRNWAHWLLSYFVGLLLLLTLPGQAQNLAWQQINYANPEPVDQSLGNSGGVITDAKPDGSGNLIMVGYYSNIIDFPKVGGGNIRLVSDLYSTMFVGKWSTSSRAWVWVSSTKGASGNAIALNGSDIYVTGSYGGSDVTIAGTRLPDKGTNDSDAFVAKYTDNGTSLSDGWAISFGGTTVPSSDAGRAIVINGNNLYVAGAFYGTATIAGTTLTSAGQGDMFLAKYNLSTAPATGRWAIGGGDVRQDQVNAMAVSGSNIYIGGAFAKSLVLSGTTLTTDVIQNRDLFLAKLVDNGASAGNGWAVSAGGNTGTGKPESLDNMRLVGSDIYFTGVYSGSGATIANVTLSSSFTSTNMYVAKYTDAGSSVTPRWATGITNATNYSQGNDVEVIGNNVYVTGSFSGTDVIAGTSFTSGGLGGDSFVAAYTDNGNSVADKAAIVGGSPEDTDQAYVFALSGGSLYALGYVRNGATFGNNTVQSTGRSVIPFIAKLSIPAVGSLAPTVTTNPASNISGTSATLGGNVTADGGASVTGRGVVYSSTNTNPTIGGSGVTTTPNGMGTGTFSATISALAAGTTYYASAYATNSVNTSYGSVISFTTPTTISSITRAGTNPTNAGTVIYTVRFASPVSGLTINNFSLSTTGLTGTSITGVANSGNNTYTVAVNTGSGSGTLGLDLVNTTGINPAVSNTPFTGEVYAIDKIAPTISSVSVPANGTYSPRQAMDFTVNFSETVTVTGSPALGLTVGSTNRQAGYYSFVSGPQALVFRYAPRTNDLDTDGITLASALTLSNGTIRDAAGNTAILTLNNVPATTGILVDGVAPTVVSSNRQSPAGETTNATSLGFRVTFSESVTGVSTNSFSLINPTGSVSGSIASVVAVNGNLSTYDVTVNNVSGNGTLRLDVKGIGSAVMDLVENELEASFTTGQTFTIDQTPPTVSITSSMGTNGGSTRNSPIPFSVSFSESVTDFEGTDVTVTNGTVMGFSGGGNAYTFNVTPSTNGAVTVAVAANKAQDVAGNGNTAATPFSINYLPLTLTGFAPVSPSVCTGSPLSFSATVSNADGPYSYTLTNGPSSVTGTATGTAFNRTITAADQGAQSFTLVVTDASQRVSASQTVTVNALPVVSITGLASAYCQDAATVTLMGSPSGATGNFTIDGTSASTLNPISLTVGQHTVVYRYTDGNGCANSVSQSVTIKATPPAPSLLTQTGQSYPGSQSAVTVDLNTGNVTLVASGCAGTVNWTGPNNAAGSGTTITVLTNQAGLFTYQANCTINGCTGPAATATVRVGGRLTLLHRDVDNYADNNAIQPLIQIQNQGAGALPLSRLTLRYYVTVEGGGTLGNLSMNYAQVGNQNVRLRYVPLNPVQQGATGYVEYSFTDGAGSLAAGANSGSIQSYFTKSDYGPLNELDDYSYNPVRNQLTGNLRITAYYDGVLIAGIEPGSTTQIRAVRALTESKNGPSATQINTYLEVRNEGNVAINYSDLKVLYYFTSDGNERLLVEVDEGNVSTRLVKLPQVVNGADTYLEIRFNQSGQLAPGTSTGTIRYRISKPDGGRFNQANDYSYQEQPQDRSQNSRVVVYASNDRIWGQEPSGPARVVFAESTSVLSVKVLGNPIQNDQVTFEVSGAEGQPLQLQLLTPQGRVVHQQQVPSAGETQGYQFSMAAQAGGLYLLQVSTPTQSQTVKVLKAN